MTLTAEMLIGNLMDAMQCACASTREQYFLRESLRSLVRLAQAEQLNEIRANAKFLTGMSREVTHGLGGALAFLDPDKRFYQQGQGELEFDHPDFQRFRPRDDQK